MKKMKYWYQLVLLVVCVGSSQTTVAEWYSGTVEDVSAGASGSFSTTSRGWFRMSSDRSGFDGWISVSPSQSYVAATLPIFFNTGFGADATESITVQTNDHPRLNTVRFFQARTSVGGGTRNPDSISVLGYIDAGTSHPFLYAQIPPNPFTNRPTESMLLTNPLQAAIAATALIGRRGITWEKGCVYFYNASTNLLDQNCNVFTDLALNN